MNSMQLKDKLKNISRESAKNLNHQKFFIDLKNKIY